MERIDLSVAAAFAIGAHAAVGQLCRESGGPYSDHCERVVARLLKTGFNAEAHRSLLEAAWLHDVIEDTKVSRELIESLFGGEVGRIVTGVTNVYTHHAFPNLSRKMRKEKEHERLSGEDWAVQTLKCADVADNAQRLPRYPDRAFARLYIRELEHLIEGLDRADSGMLANARHEVHTALLAIEA